MTKPEAEREGSDVAGLTAKRLLAQNALWSLVGQAVPMVAAAVALPVMLHALGAEAFGILSISWVVIGYFGLFDLGLGRAITRLVAEGLGGGDTSELPAQVGTALLILLGFGATGSVALAAATPWLVHDVLKVAATLETDARATLCLLAISLPAVLVTAGLGGVLAAQQRFRALNLIRIPMSLLSFVLPLAVLPYTHSLAFIVGIIVAVRFVGTFAHLGVCAATMPELRRGARWVPALAPPLLRSGGWLAVINLLVPLFATLDRVLVGAWISVGDVAHYAPPQEVATKLWILPGTLAVVVFPAFATNHGKDPRRSQALFLRALKQVHCILLPVTLALIVAGGDLLLSWLGGEVGERASIVIQWLAAGALFTGLSFIPSAFIQAAGRPRDVAWLLILEAPLFVLSVWWGARVAGTAGVAVAWALRALVDLVALLILAVPSLPDGRGMLRSMLSPAAATLAALAGAFAVHSLTFAARMSLLAAVLVPFGIWVASRGLSDERRALSAVLFRRD